MIIELHNLHSLHIEIIEKLKMLTHSYTSLLEES